MVGRALGLHRNLGLNLLITRVEIAGARRQVVNLVLDYLAAKAGGGALDHGEIILVLRRVAADHEPSRPFLPDQILRQRVGPHGVVGNDVEHVGAAFLLAELGGAGTDVHDQRVLGLRQIGHGEQIGGLEIGDDEAFAIGEQLLGLGHHVGVVRDDRLDELEGMADEASGLIGLLEHQARALDALIGNRLFGVRERQWLRIVLAEIDHPHVLLGFGGGGCGGGGGRSSRLGRRGLIRSRGRWRLRRLGQSRRKHGGCEQRQGGHAGKRLAALTHPTRLDKLHIGNALLVTNRDDDKRRLGGTRTFNGLIFQTCRRLAMRTAQYGKAIHHGENAKLLIIWIWGISKWPSRPRQSFCQRLPATKEKPPGPARLGGLEKVNADGRPYCSGGLPAELGLTERMKAMIFHS